MLIAGGSVKNIQHIASGINVFPLLTSILRQPELWNQHPFREKNLGPHVGVDDIWVRYNDWKNYTGDKHSFNDFHDSVWYPSYYALPQVRDIIFPLMQAVEGERLGGVLITRIPAHGSVKPHIDSGWHVDYYDKYAIQLQSNSKQSFNFHGESFISSPGDIYKFNNKKEHWVINDSDFDRITLIVCIKSNKLLEEV